MQGLSEIQQQIFDKVKENWVQRVGKGAVDEVVLASIIKLADTEGDGKKRVTVEGKGTYLVPIEDIILVGIKAQEIEKYPRAGEKDEKI